jgi:hypothetical protein
VARGQAAEHIDERGNPDHARHPAEQVDESITKQCHDDNEATEDRDAEAVVDAEQFADSLSGQHRATGRKAYIHQADRDERNDRAINAELHSGGNHLRQAQLRPLGTVERHHRAAGQLAREQRNERPEHIATQDDGQGAGDNGGNLQIRAEPQGKLACQSAVALGIGHIVDRADFDRGGRCPVLFGNCH